VATTVTCAARSSPTIDNNRSIIVDTPKFTDLRNSTRLPRTPIRSAAALCPNLEVAGVLAYPALMDNTFKIELVNDNEYAVRSLAEGQPVESLFRIDPDYLDRIGLATADGKRVVEETARFLAEHQPVIDFPPMIDIEDITAAYEDYPQQLRNRRGME
jgi:hypothetical protein